MITTVEFKVKLNDIENLNNIVSTDETMKDRAIVLDKDRIVGVITNVDSESKEAHGVLWCKLSANIVDKPNNLYISDIDIIL